MAEEEFMSLMDIVTLLGFLVLIFGPIGVIAWLSNKYERYGPDSNDLFLHARLYLPWNWKHARFDWRPVMDDVIPYLFSLPVVGFLLFAITNRTGEVFAVVPFASLSLFLTLVTYGYRHILPRPEIEIHWLQKHIDAAEKKRKGDARTLALLYRILAKKYHPDRARTLAQKAYFENSMKRINEAYSKKDLQTLIRFAAFDASAADS